MSFLFLPEDKAVAKKNKNEKRENNTQIITKIKSILKAILVLCSVNLVQNIVTPPLWSMIFPLYFTSVIGMPMKLMGSVFTKDNILGVLAHLLVEYGWTKIIISENVLSFI